MGTVKNAIGRTFSRISEMVTFWSIVPSGFLAGVSAYLSTGVQWIAAYGAWGWFATGVLTFFVSSVSFALISRTKLWRIEAKNRARIQGDSSPFDPMARVYENKRLHLKDLAPLGRRQVVGKRFLGCEIIGPGSAILGIRARPDSPDSTLKNCNTFDVDCIQIDEESKSHLAITFLDCDFDQCNFYHMSLLFYQRQNDTLSWITPDFRQVEMLTDQTQEQSEHER